MSSFRPIASLLCAGAVVALATPAFAAPAFADQVPPLTVAGKLPTSITISLVGKAAPQVKGEIRDAASTVCRNAFFNGELGFYGDAWCTVRTADRAYDHYDAIMHAKLSVASVTIQPGATN